MGVGLCSYCKHSYTQPCNGENEACPNKVWLDKKRARKGKHIKAPEFGGAKTGRMKSTGAHIEEVAKPGRQRLRLKS